MSEESYEKTVASILRANCCLTPSIMKTVSDPKEIEEGNRRLAISEQLIKDGYAVGTVTRAGLITLVNYTKILPKGLALLAADIAELEAEMRQLNKIELEEELRKEAPPCSVKRVIARKLLEETAQEADAKEAEQRKVEKKEVKFELAMRVLKNCWPLVIIALVGLGIKFAGDVWDSLKKFFPAPAVVVDTFPKTAWEANVPKGQKVYRYMKLKEGGDRVECSFYFEKGEFVSTEGSKWAEADRGAYLEYSRLKTEYRAKVDSKNRKFIEQEKYSDKTSSYGYRWSDDDTAEFLSIEEKDFVSVLLSYDDLLKKAIDE